MNIKEQLKAAAILEGIVYPVVLTDGVTVAGFIADIETRRNYLHNHNDIQRLIDGLDDRLLAEYYNILFWMPCFYNKQDILKATCEQKLEAILKAYDVWDD